MAVESATSLTLLQRVCTGDERAWQRLVGLYTPLVCHWCGRWGLQPADVDDVRQDVFIAVSRGIDRFRKERSCDTFRGWLRGITRNKLLEYGRQRGGRPDAVGGSDAYALFQDVPMAEAVADPPEDAEAVAGLYRRVMDVIREEFEERTWKAFYRVTVDEQSAGDVGQELGMSANAVRIAKWRVLRRLREEAGDLTA